MPPANVTPKKMHFEKYEPWIPVPVSYTHLHLAGGIGAGRPGLPPWGPRDGGGTELTVFASTDFGDHHHGAFSAW